MRYLLIPALIWLVSTPACFAQLEEYEAGYRANANDYSDAGRARFVSYCLSIAELYEQRGDATRAWIRRDIALHLCRGNASQSARLAETLAAQAKSASGWGQWTRAQVFLEEAIQVSGKNAQPYQLALVDNFISAGRLKKADELFNSLKPDELDANYKEIQAKLLRAQGKEAEATAAQYLANTLRQAEVLDRRGLGQPNEPSLP